MKMELLRLKLLTVPSPDITDNGKRDSLPPQTLLLLSLHGPEDLLTEQSLTRTNFYQSSLQH
jgi:hypothetical protein